MGRARPPDPDIPGTVAGNPSGRPIAGNRRWADSPRGMPRACLSHAHPLQFLSAELPSRPDGRGEVRRLQTRLGFAGQLAFSSHRRGAVLSRHKGSGTIFFTSCNMRCAFCQNGDISTDKDNGEETDPRTLAAMAWMLRREGCHNIN
jgi:hypothetical protein